MAPDELGLFKSCFAELRRLARRWVLITAVVAALLCAVFRPLPCAFSERCKAQHADTSGTNPYFVGWLSAALFYEGISMWLTYRSTVERLMGLVEGIEQSLLPGILMCICFAGLGAEQIGVGYIGLVHAAHPGVGFQDSQPVYTIITLEWLLTVPCLMLLAGKCLMARPLQEVSRPLVVTNVYILIAWSAHFMAYPWLRWAAVAVALTMYVWASVDMVAWTTAFNKMATHNDEIVCRSVRPLLVHGLIGVFAVYGVVYLLGFSGFATAEYQRSFYHVLNILVKAVYAASFVGISMSQYQELVLNLLLNVDHAFERKIACMVPEDDDADPIEEEKSKFI